MGIRTACFAGSAIPISDLKTVALYEADNRVHIQAGARLEGFANIDLNADGWGDVGVTGVAKATNWTSAVASALGGGNVGSGNGKRRAESFGEVINDGSVITGQRRNRILFTKVDTITGLTVVDMSKTTMINGVATGTTLDDAGRATQRALAEAGRRPGDAAALAGVDADDVAHQHRFIEFTRAFDRGVVLGRQAHQGGAHFGNGRLLIGQADF